MNTRRLALLMLLPLVAVAAEPQGAGDRVAGMFTDLMGELLSLVGAVMAWGFGMGLLGFVVGGVGAFFLWRWMRNRGWLDGSWRWCVKGRWVWAVLLILVFSIGGCSTGLVWGAGHGAKRWVREGQFLEKSAGHLYAALMLFRAEARDGNEKADALLEKDIARVVGITRQAREKARELGDQATGMEEDARKQLDAWADDQEMTGVKRWVLKHVMEFLWEQQAKIPMEDNEAAALLKEAADIDQPEGDREVARQAIDRVAGSFRVAAILFIDAQVEPLLWIIIPTTLAVAIGPLCIFWFACWVGGRGKKPPGEPPLADPPAAE